MWRMPVDLDASKRDADLVAYYDNEVRSRAQRRLPPQRVAHRAGFIELVKGEGRGSILEIGSGPGRDGQTFANAGLAYTGVDLSPRSVAEFVPSAWRLWSPRFCSCRSGTLRSTQVGR